MSSSDPFGYRAFHALVKRLRAECPWDIEQTHRSLLPYLIEETYEVVDAIDQLEIGGDAELIEELGDLLYQIEFHAAIAEQQGRFTMADVTRGIHDKLVRRHPHVFDETVVGDPDEVSANWEAIKRAEKPERSSALDGVANSLPALSLAREVQRKAARLGFDWSSVAESATKVNEELGEVLAVAGDETTSTVDTPTVDTPTVGTSTVGTRRAAEEVGDLLFAVVNLARHVGVDPESALRSATKKFSARFRTLETAANDEGTNLADLGVDELTQRWERVKNDETGSDDTGSADTGSDGGHPRQQS